MKNKLLVTSLSTILGLYSVLILFLIIVFNIVGWDLQYLILISVIILFLQFLLSPIFMDLTMKWFYNAKFDFQMPDYLIKYIQDECTKNNMKYPKIGYILDSAPNAFTYGRTKNDARIVLTQGIFELLSPEEVKTVVAHELGHAVHYDMFLMTAAQLVPLILYYIYDVFTADVDSDDESGGLKAIGLLAYVLYIISEYVILWFSRTREYYADEFSVKSTKNPNALASALVKIGYGLTIKKHDEQNEIKKDHKGSVTSVSALGIFDSKASKSLVAGSYDDGEISKENIKKAARWELWNPWAKWFEFNSTHPLISNRIKHIDKYSEEYGQHVFVDFDEKKPESYVDDFILELFINFLPTLVLFFVIILGIVIIIAPDNKTLAVGVGVSIYSLSLLVPYSRSHKNKNYKKMVVSDLLAEVKVSGVTSIPCIVNGQIIGKGEPGSIFSEDFVLKDDSGIIYLDYNQPLAIFNTLFALLKSDKYINKNVEIKGWYRRCPVPYIEIREIVVDGVVKKCHTYTFVKCFIYFFILFGILLSVFSII